MFLTSAYAAGESVGTGSGSLVSVVIPFVIIFVLMYFLMIRPQQKQMRKKQEQLNAIRRGDTIVTGGGVIGRVTRVIDENNEIEVEIAENVRIRVTRFSISDVRAKESVTTEGDDVKKTSTVKEKRSAKKTTTKKPKE